MQAIESPPAMPASHPALKRILVVRNDRLGDAVLTVPAVAAVRQCWPDAHLSLLVQPSLVPFWQTIPGIDQLLPDRTGPHVREMAASLARQQFDAALVINTNRRNLRIVRRAGIPVRVAWSGKLASWLYGNRLVRLRRSHPPVHESVFAMAFVRRLSPELPELPGRLSPELADLDPVAPAPTGLSPTVIPKSANPGGLIPTDETNARLAPVPGSTTPAPVPGTDPAPVPAVAPGPVPGQPPAAPRAPVPAGCCSVIRRATVPQWSRPQIPLASVRRVEERLTRLLGTAWRERPLFAVHPGNRGSAANWPPHQYGELARRLTGHGNVAVTGVPAERELVHTVVDATNGNAIPICDQPLTEFMAFLQYVDVLTISSTGPMHLAGLLGTPTVALFGDALAESPLKWAPLGDRCTIVTPESNEKRGDRPLRRSAKPELQLAGERVFHSVLAAARQYEGQGRRKVG